MINSAEARTAIQFASAIISTEYVGLASREPTADDAEKLRDAAARLSAIADAIEAK